MSAGEIAELYTADTEKYAKAIREAGIKLSEQGAKPMEKQ